MANEIGSGLPEAPVIAQAAKPQPKNDAPSKAEIDALIKALIQDVQAMLSRLPQGSPEALRAAANMSLLISLQNGASILPMNFSTIVADINTLKAETAGESISDVFEATNDAASVMAEVQRARNSYRGTPLTEQAWQRITLGAQRITPQNIHAMAERVMGDDHLPKHLHDNVATRVAGALEATGTVAAHNAASPEARVAVNTELEEQKALLEKIKHHPKCSAKLKAHLATVDEQKLFSPEILESFRVCEDELANGHKHHHHHLTTAEGKVAEAVKHEESNQHKDLMRLTPALLKELDLPDNYVQSQGGWPKIFHAASAIHQDAARLSAAQDAWQKIEQGDMAGLSAQLVADANNLRLASLALPTRLASQIASLELQHDMAPAIAKLQDLNLSVAERGAAVKAAIIKNNPGLAKVPPDIFDHALDEAIRVGDQQQGGIASLALVDEDARYAAVIGAGHTAYHDLEKSYYWQKPLTGDALVAANVTQAVANMPTAGLLSEGLNAAADATHATILAQCADALKISGVSGGAGAAYDDPKAKTHVVAPAPTKGAGGLTAS